MTIVLCTLAVQTRAVAQCQDYEITLINGPDCPPFGSGAGGVAITEQGAIAGITSNCSTVFILVWTGGPGYQSILPAAKNDEFHSICNER
jgi:hypothetical protein